MIIPVRKIALGLTLASGAALTAWLLTGDRKQKTRSYIVRHSEGLRKVLKTDQTDYDDSEAHYI